MKFNKAISKWHIFYSMNWVKEMPLKTKKDLNKKDWADICFNPKYKDWFEIYYVIKSL